MKVNERQDISNVAFIEATIATANTYNTDQNLKTDSTPNTYHRNATRVLSNNHKNENHSGNNTPIPIMPPNKTPLSNEAIQVHVFNKKQIPRILSI